MDSELNRGRQRVLKFASNDITPSFLQDLCMDAFRNLNWAAKVNFALGFVLRNVEEGSYCYYYAREKTILLEKSLLLAKNDGLLDVHKKLGDLNLVERSARKRSSTKWKFLFTTNVTSFAALSKEVPKCC